MAAQFDRTAQSPFVIASSGTVTLRKKFVSVPLSSGRSGSAGSILASRLGSLGPTRRIYLVARGLKTDVQPGEIYELYLNLDPSTKPNERNAYYVGSINFFGARGDEDSFFSFDATDVVRSLHDRKKLDNKITVAIVSPGEPDTSATPSIARIDLIER